ncbi:MAG TPA: lantibiotic dehydratase [Thermoanaerobaculia bacterium]|nr:lantibiotic dehydratase [Thermoanaerobaculia bacterium]
MTGPPPGARLALLRIAALPFEALAPLAARESRAPLTAAWELEARLAAAVPRLTEELYRAAGEAPAAAGRRAAVIALRRALHNGRRIAPAQLAAVRGHLPPQVAAAVEEHLALRAELAGRLAEHAAAYRRDLLAARRALLCFAGRPVVREGMRLVSRALLERLTAMQATDPAGWRHGERHAAAKLAAYAGRFTTKTSPNAVFCATALAWIGGGEASVRGTNRPARRDVLLSVAEARKVAACLAADRAAWPAIVPRPNPTLRRDADGESWLYWRPATPRRADDDEVLSRARVQPVLDLFLDEAAAETFTVPGLLAAVAARSGHTVEELAAFCAQLIEQGLLIAEIEPPYNARRPLACVAAALRAAGAAAPWLAEIEAIERAVAEMPGLAAEERIAAMDRVEARLTALPHERKIKGDELFRLDVASAIEITLPERVRAELETPLRRCVRLFAGLYPEQTLRAGWVQRFLSRHPPGVEMPLLDLYHGLFEPEPAERPAAFPQPRSQDPAAARFRRVREIFAARARAALATGEEEAALTDGDWEELVGDLPEPAWSAGVLFQIAAASPEAITAGRYRIVLNGLFGTGIALARFAGLHDDGADGAVTREVARGWEPLARPGAILAEITYTHQGRSANAGLRPALFRHEIELPGDRATPGAEVIPLRELTVRWDAASGRFRLRWVPRDLEVVPVISSGINPEGFVAFLAGIGRQGLQPLGWFPGFDVPDLPAWPRITSGRLVLFRRRWEFAPGTAPEIPPEGSGPGDPDTAGALFFARTARWQREHGLPRHVFVHTAADPKPFYVDQAAPLAVDLLRRALVPAPGAAAAVLHVTEMLPGPDEMWVRDEHGRYAAELLLHLTGPHS